jgi:hypothetical protein
MKILCLDVSTSTGWAVIEGERGEVLPKIVDYGIIKPPKTLTDWVKEEGYPKAYVSLSKYMAGEFARLARQYAPEVIVVEETNPGKGSRYIQKILEFMHYALIDEFTKEPSTQKVVYVSSSTWRASLSLRLSKTDKKNNLLLSKATKAAEKAGKAVDKKTLGIRGKINKKHIAIRYVNLVYPELQLKAKDDDLADAICQGLSYLRGAEICDGIPGGKKR